MGVRGQAKEETNGSFFYSPQTTTDMTHTNNEVIQRVVDEILKVIPEQSQINSDPTQCQLLKVTIKLHWGNKIEKILKVLTPVGARQTIPSQFIGDVLELWKLQIIRRA